MAQPLKGSLTLNPIEQSLGDTVEVQEVCQ
jgi:hypothetical protein